MPNNVDDIINYLSRSFREATNNSKKIGNVANRIRNKNTGDFETTMLYDYQVEFAYIINELKKCPEYKTQKYVYVANELINEIKKLG